MIVRNRLVAEKESVVDNPGLPGKPREMTPATTMKAMTITSPGSVEAREIRRPDPGPGQLRIQVEGCGICASNLGPWGGLPVAPARLTAEVATVDGSIPVAVQPVLDFSRALPEDDRFWQVYASGTYQNVPNSTSPDLTTAITQFIG